MAENLNIALLITLIGMGLVFMSILVLWGVMALLMRLTQSREAGDARTISEPIKQEGDLRAQAAAVAVAVALHRDAESGPHEFPLPPTAIVSAWQAVMRSNIIRKRGQVR